ncbi:hypothetical protein ETR_23016 [Erwinia tracheiphila PSU-1]|uniref:Uncharacterized protein n=1 Tax=Erwinia tracheiphila TaxID=65700 RepID=A0A345CPI6_9GAMM|nr:hypothetical protein AV903_03310 [Erwinia tracheiphila]EOS92702.1 hypothetical protein ETR_23016 [Erwinia tracheiphila PSU-1]
MNITIAFVYQMICWKFVTWFRLPNLSSGAQWPEKESRGLHYIVDYPKTLPQATPTILVP